MNAKPTKEEIQQKTKEKDTANTAKIEAIKTCKASGKTIDECVKEEKAKDKAAIKNTEKNKTEKEKKKEKAKLEVKD